MSNAKAIVSGLVGLAAGTVIGAAFMRYKKDQEIDLIVDEYEDEINYWMDKCEDREEVLRDVGEIDEEEDEEDFREEMPDGYFNYSSINQPKKKPGPKPDPTELFAQNEHPQDETEEGDILEENPIEEDRDMKEPRLISADKFDDDGSFEKETLYYYQEDGVLTDADDNELENEYEYVGDTLDKYDFRNSEEQLVHVRNDEKSTDYEVLKVFSAYRSNY